MDVGLLVIVVSDPTAIDFLISDDQTKISQIFLEVIAIYSQIYPLT